MSSDHIDDLRAQAEYARQRFQLYKAKAYGQRPTSPVRMRELERENKDLRRANEILKSAAAFFGAELDRRSSK